MKLDAASIATMFVVCRIIDGITDVLVPDGMLRDWLRDRQDTFTLGQEPPVVLVRSNSLRAVGVLGLHSPGHLT